MSIPQEIGRNIVFMRRKVGTTQEWLSLETEIAISYLREIEHGRANPTLDILGRIARALQIPVEFLVVEDLEHRYAQYFPETDSDRVLFTEAEAMFLHYVLRMSLCPCCRDRIEEERQRFKQLHDSGDISLLKKYMGR